jgi:hypothetical protein
MSLVGNSILGVRQAFSSRSLARSAASIGSTLNLVGVAILQTIIVEDFECPQL